MGLDFGMKNFQITKAITPSNITEIPPLVIFAVLDMCVIESGLFVFWLLGVVVGALGFELLVDVFAVV